MNVGKFGPYIIYKGENHRLPKDVLPETITFEEAVKLITAAPKSSKRKNAAKK